MKIKKQDEQHMVLASPLGEWLLAIALLVLVIGFVCFVGLLVCRELLGLDLLIPTIVISVVFGLYILGKIVGNKVVIDKLTKSIMVEKRHFLLIHRQRVIPFSAVKHVGSDYKPLPGHGAPGPHLSQDMWKVSLFFSVPQGGVKKVKITNSQNAAEMKRLANEIGVFIRK